MAWDAGTPQIQESERRSPLEKLRPVANCW